ncbi:MAG: mechanosensitive ion channel, partial [Bacteroidales bacterium]|nr:mechanosensitive ion channel [Bacteroidales bacterium]
FIEQGLTPKQAGYLASGVIIFGILIISWIANFLTKRVILVLVKHYVNRSKNQWDDVFYEKKVFNKLSQLAPALVIYFLIPLGLPHNVGWVRLIQTVTSVYMILIVMLTVVAFFNAISEIYMLKSSNKGKSIKSYIQAINIFVFFIGIIVSLSILLHKDLTYFITGLGAMAAVLLLIFKDSILGLVAGIQLSANKMVEIGDWIVVPKYNADGTVEEVTLNIVKVRNWDKTITSVPTYALISESFVNWRGMEESGGRRIKRSLLIDMKTVRFLEGELLDRLSKVELLKDYIVSKQKEITEYNTSHNFDESVLVNGRHMTNLGTFRKYLENYLHQNENIRPDMTFLVRHLEPMERGIPIEIYVFSKVQEWVEYEDVQANIFDHILAVLPQFELAVFQNPSGHDIQELAAIAKSIKN